MKKLSSLVIIICLLLTSCQLESGNLSSESNPVSITEGTTELYTVDINSFTETTYTTGVTEPTDISGIPVPEETLTADNSVTASSQKVTSATSSQVQTTNKPTSAVRPTVPTTKKPTVPATQKPTAPTTQPQPSASEMRAIWISCYDYTSAAGKTRAQYKAVTDKMFRTIKSNGLNTAFVHLRANSDAFYKSSIFPYSVYIAGKEGASLPFDPFEVLLESAAANGISVHGWINPFRVSTQNKVAALSATNPAKIILDSGNADGRVCVLSNGIYYNPADTENHKLILDGVKEIISKYNIDGIHIDDYFYPSTDASIDKTQYNTYRQSGGTLTLAKWRVANINAFVSALYSTVKATDSSLVVSISPSGQLDKTLRENSADCRTWLSHKGYADMIIPQIYFGFNHQTEDFNKLLKQWASLPRHSSVRLVCGIAAYKCAKADNYAGSGKTEWQNSTDILARQITAIRSNKNYSGFAVFSYADLERAACKTEIENMKKTISAN
ncbi:MAG: family 10 glycosylhydrolase [Clostridia bacterium]|nr:family 10 glycosylhydrolase [Clostridia bacterium]